MPAKLLLEQAYFLNLISRAQSTSHCYLEDIIGAEYHHWRIQSDPEEDDGAVLGAEATGEVVKRAVGQILPDKFQTANQRDADRTCTERANVKYCCKCPNTTDEWHLTLTQLRKTRN